MNITKKLLQMTAFCSSVLYKCIYEQVLVLACVIRCLFYYARDCCIDLRQINPITAVCYFNKCIGLMKGQNLPQNMFADVMFSSLMFDILTHYFSSILKTRYKLYLCT